MKKASIVVGLGFGDEGKGLCTDYLCGTSVGNTLVVRFNGGQQAGHNVVLADGRSHVFSNFGSGTLRGLPTYWSRYCTFSPAYLIKELEELEVDPILFLDNLAPVTTHYDVLYNRAVEFTRGDNRHGSCGAGYGATVERQKNLSLQLFAKELFDERLLRLKLGRIKRYYQKKMALETMFDFSDFDHQLEDQRFFGYVERLRALCLERVVALMDENEVMNGAFKWDNYIFEGAQGILLDVELGFKPNVTKSNTTSKNAIEVIERNFAKGEIEVEIYYVSRCYHSRHGAGPFFENSLELRNNEAETNSYNIHQGKFRVGFLNVNLVNYALHCDRAYSKDIQKNMLVTCLDQFATGTFPIIWNGNFSEVTPGQLIKLLDVQLNKCFLSYGNCSDSDIIKIT